MTSFDGNLKYEGGTDMNKKQNVRVAAASLAVVIASAGLLAFRSQDNGADRPALERYNPAAVEAVGKDIPANDGEIVVVMEVRNVCQQSHEYASGDAALEDVTASIDGSTRAALDAGKRLDQPVDITEFANFAKSRIEASEKSGSTKPVEEFLASECSSTDNSIPVLAEG